MNGKFLLEAQKSYEILKSISSVNKLVNLNFKFLGIITLLTKLMNCTVNIYNIPVNNTVLLNFLK